MEELFTRNIESDQLPLPNDEVRRASETASGAEEYLALNTEFNDVKERYRKAQELATDLQKEIKQNLQRIDDEMISDTQNNRVVKLQQETTELKKKMGFLEAELNVIQKHLSEGRFAERGDEWLEVDAANKKIEELYLERKLKQDEFANVKMLQEELETKLQKSSTAYTEKYNECEELRKTLEKHKFTDVTDSVQVPKCPETRCPEDVDTQTESPYFGEEKFDSFSKEMQAVSKCEDEPIKKLEHLRDYLKQMLGLEILEENEEYDIVLTNRDRLQHWLTQETFNIRRVEEKETLTDPDSLTAWVTQINSNEYQKQVFVRVGEILRDAKLLQGELEQQRNCLKQLATVTQKRYVTTDDSHAAKGGRFQTQVGGVKALLPKRDTEMSSMGAREKEGKIYSNTATEPVSLSVPVQETMKRLQTTKSGDSRNTPRTDDEEQSRRSESQADSLLGAEGGFVEIAMEIRGEEDTDHFVGEASAMDGRICPVCSDYFSMTVQQEVFEQHVQSHFYSDDED